MKKPEFEKRVVNFAKFYSQLENKKVSFWTFLTMDKASSIKIFFFLFLLLIPTIVWSQTSSFSQKLVQAALERTKHSVIYDGSYHVIDYPGGDVPANIGVCTDVVIRSYRALGIDLQKLVHEDMRANFGLYPSRKIWGLKRPDKNIDHRRVPNLKVFFKRKGKALPVTKNPKNYQPGDLVTWMLPGNLPHIGIVTDQKNIFGTPLIVHNIGQGPKLENILFSYPITGHYRFDR